ncbi:MAG: IS66 family insertion sequence element accessory protein TnpB [Acidobacteriota bacterium]|nr:IS66 family insertion sequence element accessory protein TnpB [Acidobacteriota bacterium]
MRWPGRRVTVYAYDVPTDMRKGCDGLCALVTHRLARDPLSGDVYLFLSRNRVRAKVLHFDGTGLCVYAKRLERGRFASLWRDAPAEPITLTISELDLFLDGSTLVGRVALTPPALSFYRILPGKSTEDGRQVLGGYRGTAVV